MGVRALAKLGAGSFLIKVLGLLLGLLSSMLLARVLGPRNLGIYVYAFTLVTLISIPLHRGLTTLLVRQVSVYHAHKQWGLLHGLLRLSNASVAVLASVVVAGAAVIALLMRAQIDSAQFYTFLMALVLLPIYSLANLRGATLSGLRFVLGGQMPEQVIRPTILIVLLAFCYFRSVSLAPQQAMAMQVAAAAVAFVFGVGMLMKVLPREVRSAVPLYERSAWLGALLPFTLISSINAINGSADVVLLGMLRTKSDVGQFRVAEQIATLVSFSLTALNVVVAPQIARLYALGDRDALQSILTWSARIVFVTALPAAIVFIVFGKWLLAFAFGERYVDAYPVLVILCIAQLVNAMCGSVGNVLNMSGHEKDTVVSVLVAAIANVALNLVLIPRYGPAGAATATAVSLAIWNVVLAWRVHVRTGLSTTVFGRTRAVQR